MGESVAVDSAGELVGVDGGVVFVGSVERVGRAELWLSNAVSPPFSPQTSPATPG